MIFKKELAQINKFGFITHIYSKTQNTKHHKPEKQAVHKLHFLKNSLVFSILQRKPISRVRFCLAREFIFLFGIQPRLSFFNSLTRAQRFSILDNSPKGDQVISEIAEVVGTDSDDDEEEEYQD